MSSGGIDFGVGIEEMSTIDSALERLTKNKPKPKPESKSADRKPKQEGQGGPQKDKPKPKASSEKPDKKSPAKAEATPGPWVNGTYKVRDSKKTALARLSLERKLAGLETHTIQAMFDDAMDYAIAKYAIKKKA